jgi:hypothetical protein
VRLDQVRPIEVGLMSLNSVLNEETRYCCHLDNVIILTLHQSDRILQLSLYLRKNVLSDFVWKIDYCLESGV